MSTLKDFVHHKLGAKPGPAPEPPAPSASAAPGPGGAKQSGAVDSSAKAARARAEGDLKGDLFYTQAQARPSVKGWVESDETVEHKLYSKEEFPQG